MSACQSVAPAGIYEQAQTVASCSLAGHTDVETVFVSFATEADARATYDSLLQGAGWEPDTGSCTSDEGGEIGWEGLGASGRIQCFQTGVPETPAGVIWTTDGFPIIGHLTAHTPGTGPSVLYAAWQEISIYGR